MRLRDSARGGGWSPDESGMKKKRIDLICLKRFEQQVVEKVAGVSADGWPGPPL